MFVESGVEYAVNWDENGYLAEGSTENILLVSPDKQLLIPSYERVLKGVTMTRVIELAEGLLDKGILTGVKTTYIDRELAAKCPEVMLSGTTLDVLPVNRWDGRQVGGGVPRPVAKTLLKLIRKDITENEELLTPLFD
jgi:branched-chain amino acid aminotransferase